MQSKSNPRKHTRLADHDYSSPGAYFVTICTYGKHCFLSRIDGTGTLELSKAGRIAEQEILKTAEVRENVAIDSYVIMPNHIHFILIITEQSIEHGRREFSRPHSSSLSTIIGLIKSNATRRIRLLLGQSQFIVWQDGFYEHIIRDERALQEIRQYIANNPGNWAEDVENPDRVVSLASASATRKDLP